MTKRDVINEDDIEIYYKQCRKIKFKIENKTKKYSLKNIFKKMCKIEQHNPSATVYMKGGHHCEYGKVRSLDDILKLAKYYNPKKTVKEIIIELTKYKNGKLNYMYCHNIRKYNFHGIGYFRCFIDNLNFLKFTTLGFSNAQITLKEFIT